MHILVVEPQCRGFEHAQFNAALLSTISAAYPSAQIEFWADPDHTDNVMELRGAAGASSLNIKVAPISLRSFKAAWPGAVEQAHLVSVALRRARYVGSRALVFCSASAGTILAIKRLAYRCTALPILAIPHSALMGLRRRSRRFWNHPIDIRTAVHSPQPDNVRLIALSRTILETVSNYSEPNYWRQMDHPFMFGTVSGATRDRHTHEGLVLGILGHLRGTAWQYSALSEALHRDAPHVHLEIVGHVSPRAFDGYKFFPSPRTSPVSYAEYRASAAKCDGFLWLGDVDRHRYAVSATLLEILDYGKPSFYFSTPLTREYEARFGSFGSAFDNIELLSSALTRAAEHWESIPPSFGAFAAARSALSPAAVATQFTEAVES